MCENIACNCVVGYPFYLIVLLKAPTYSLALANSASAIGSNNEAKASPPACLTFDEGPNNSVIRGSALLST